jgi:protein-S-isoprenylcysteine O-methyltransferase Ste14
MRVPVPWVFILAYLLGVSFELYWPSRIPQSAGTVFRVGGGVLMSAGAVVAAWSLAIFWREQTTTVPGKTSARLVTWGPYRFSRNPMYVALVMAYLGEAGILVQAWPVACLPLVVAYLNWIVIPVEESKLREAFGETYEQYRSQVRRWL